jgi:hypothetical protein
MSLPKLWQPHRASSSLFNREKEYKYDIKNEKLCVSLLTLSRESSTSDTVADVAEAVVQAEHLSWRGLSK